MIYRGKYREEAFIFGRIPAFTIDTFARKNECINKALEFMY